MAADRELYSILGVEPSASEAQIRTAYENQIAMNPEGTSKYSRIVEAYTILSNMDSRAEYDIKGKIRHVSKRRHRADGIGGTEKARYTLNTLFLAGAAVSTILFILQMSGVMGTVPFYVTCGISLLLKIAEYILRLVP